MDASRAQDGSLRLKDLHLKLRYKRLEQGAFVLPSADAGSTRIEITTEELGALLSGIDLEQAARRKRYRRDAA
jgi:IS66 Orf2 like protein